ncbi:hypothetical protein [Lysobacter enzymogenes]|uniref:hypothetical protein n=1 Tax=Lysobacter enzymogenes TaxID=69 RepID=UPI001A957771|nr:hypothetical protein [Lysobacter enzymogenes]QQP96245.1 hypothetical protein JHW38_24075 [Lysobacter enzymogenes]
MYSVLVLLAPVAIVFSFVYLCELRTFLRGLQRESAELWAELGKPVLGAAARRVVVPVMRGRFALERLPAAQRRRAARLRVYAIASTIFYLVWLVAMVFRRELGLTT